MQTLIERFNLSATRYGDQIAVHHRGRDWTYGELWQRACAVATWYRQQGLQPGQRVAILLPNSVEFIACYLGVLLARGVVVALNPDTTTRELAAVFSNCEPSVLVCNTQAAQYVHGSDGHLPLLLVDHAAGSSKWRSIQQVTEFASVWRQAGDQFDDADQGTSDDVAQIIYTSGTSGVPKGVTLNNRNLLANCDSIVTYLNLTQRDSVFVILPFFYSYGNSILVTHLAVGGRLVLAADFVFWNRALDLMEQQRVTGFSGVPSSYAMVLHKSDFRRRAFPHLRYLTSAGGALPTADIKEIRKAVPHAELFVMYGQTEATARLSTLMPECLDSKIGSIGKGIPGVELAVVGEDGVRVVPGQSGEIVARGDNVMVGYWKDPDATKSVVQSDGLHTRDLATVDDDGYIYIVGRASDIIKSGAYRVSPQEIEEVVAEVQGVAEVAVVGVPDNILGEVPVAFVVAAATAAVPDRDRILDYCTANLPRYKVVRDVHFLDALPKTSSGKVRRSALREEYDPLG